MNPLEYSFGTGVDAPTTWVSGADLALSGGHLDAVRLDFDGDGLLDDAMWDADGDGIADHSILDVDLEPGEPGGERARYFTDPTGLGTWNHEVAPPGTPAPEPAGHEAPSDRIEPLRAEITTKPVLFAPAGSESGERPAACHDGDGHQPHRVDTCRREHQAG
ncbi:hypothetical protein [Rhodococcus sp. HNM0569]|uniref:hypothetical protein n=1 Tax=Rhodococcus sp. HNM0569 TaxID=2716340 RepID=UPI003211F186